MPMQSFSTLLAQLTITWLLIDLVAFILGMLALYYVIKSAIRDGINESALVDRWKVIAAEARNKAATGTPPIPDMRADR